MNRIARILIVAATLFLSTAIAGAADARHGELSNGFRYVLGRNSGAPLVAIQLWVGHGSMDEADREAGLAHFLEHLTFRSRDIARRVESLGGDINAYTSLDRTVYHLTMPAAHWEEGLLVLNDIFSGAEIDPAAFETEREVVLEEMRKNADSPAREVYRLFFDKALSKHPARRPVIGYEQTIRAVSPDEVRRFYRRFYEPHSSFVTVVGDIDESAVTAKIKTLFGAAAAPAFSPPAREEEPAREQPVVAAGAMKIESCYVMAGFPAPGIKDSLVPAIDVLSYIYGESGTSVLNRLLKEEKQLVNYVYTYQMSLADRGFFVVQANLACENLPSFSDTLFKSLFDERIPVTEKELKKALASYESNYYFSRERFADLASDLSSSFFHFGDTEYSKRYIEAIRTVTVADVESVRRRFLKPAALTFVAVMPSSVADPHATVQAAVAPLSARRPSLAVRKLDNGVTLIVNRRDENPTFGISILSLAGSRPEDESTQGLSHFTASSILRGTSSKSYMEILDLLEGMGGTLSGASTKNITSIKGKFLSSRFDEAVGLIREILTGFDPRDDEIEKVRKLIVADIRKKKESANRLLKDLFFATAYAGTPAGFPTEGTEKTVGSFDRNRIVSHFGRIFSPTGLVVAVSGDIPADAIAKLSDVFSGLQPKGEGGTRLVTPAGSGRTARQQFHFKQSHIIAGFPVPGLTSGARPYLSLFSTILSNQSGRLFTSLRDKEGLAYALGAFMYESPESSLFNLYMGTAPEKLDRARRGLLDELSRALTDMTDDELEKARNQIITEIAMGLQENADIATVLAQNALFFDDPLYHKTFEKAIRTADRATLVRTIGNYLRPEKAIIAIIDGKNGTPAE